MFSVRSAVCTPRINSTVCISGTGFIKWTPTTFSGCRINFDNAVIDMADVLTPNTVDAPQIVFIRVYSAFFFSISSVIFSITKSHSTMSSNSVVKRIFSIISAVLCVFFLCCGWKLYKRKFASIICRHLSNWDWEISTTLVDMPYCAMLWATPVPITPAPITATFIIELLYWQAISRLSSPPSCAAICA